MIGRREFITLLGGAAAGWLLAARAQQTERVRRIGVLSPVSESDASTQRRHTSFQKRLDELGWKAGRNIQIDYRWSVGNADRLRLFARELVELKPDVILAETTPARAIVRNTHHPDRFRGGL
jgi:putative tryptophan/tyrosine transport system substrate-binding protein